MNHRETTHRPKAVRRALQCLALLLPAVAPETLRAAVRVRVELGVPAERSSTESSGYLPTLGAPPLRFAALPPPDLVSRPAAAAPPRPAMTMTESSVAMANAAAAQSAALNGATQATTPAPEAGGEQAAPSPSAEKPAPSAILPDELRPQVRPEDFLPFFQIPGSATQPGDVTLVVPVPRKASAPASETLPQSSATYTQTQK